MRENPILICVHGKFTEAQTFRSQEVLGICVVLDKAEWGSDEISKEFGNFLVAEEDQVKFC